MRAMAQHHMPLFYCSYSSCLELPSLLHHTHMSIHETNNVRMNTTAAKEQLNLASTHQ